MRIPDASGFVLCMLFSEMCHNVQNILFGFIGIIFKVICKFKISYFVIVINFKIRSYDFGILGQKTSCLFTVAVGSLCSGAEVLIYIESNALMYRRVLLREIVVVLIVGVEILQFVGVGLDGE